MCNGKPEMVESQKCLSYSFFSQPSTILWYVLHSKQPLIVTKLSVDGSFELCFRHNWDLLLALSCAKDYGVESTGCWKPFVNVHVCWWHINCKCMGSTRNKLFIKKEQKQVSTKRFLERNLAHVEWCRDSSMHGECTGWQSTKQEGHAHSDMHSIT